MKLHIIIHERFESPGAITKWVKDRQHLANYTRVYAGETLPENARGFDFLVVLGGPQSPATTKAECLHFDSSAEQTLIKQAVEADKAVLGICLGAQLIGEALGEKFDHSPYKEIGVFDVALTENAQNDPIFSKFPKTFPVAHWHGDMPGLTKDAQLLAYSEGCPRQIIRYTPKVYGFQCHFEFTKNAVDEMVKYCKHDIETGGKYVQHENALREYNYQEMNEKLFYFLDCIAPPT